MINDMHFPDRLAGKDLDVYLSKGWFRMGPTIFTTDIIPMKGTIYIVHWLRLVLDQVQYGRHQKRILSINKEFQVEIKPFILTAEIEFLYAHYKSIIDFDAPESVSSYLLNELAHTVYESYVIEIRDKGVLIAVGIFDNGDESIAGILNFYHPDYKSKSLGKYLMLLKINHAITNRKQYYYPGYIASGYTKFDYKLWVDKAATEVYDPLNERWVSVKMLMNNE